MSNPTIFSMSEVSKVNEYVGTSRFHVTPQNTTAVFDTPPNASSSIHLFTHAVSQAICVGTNKNPGVMLNRKLIWETWWGE